MSTPHQHHFIVVGTEHCGLPWLRSILRKGSHTVGGPEQVPGTTDWEHEPRHTIHDAELQRREFPIQRFEGFADRAYGECHEYLHYHLNPQRPSYEDRIPKRVWLRRGATDTIRNWMNDERYDYTMHEFSMVCADVLRAEARLEAWAAANPDVKQVWFQDLNFSKKKWEGNLQNMQELLDWLGIDYTATKEDLQADRTNRQGPNSWFYWDNKATINDGRYDAKLQQIFQRVRSRIYTQQYDWIPYPLDFSAETGEADKATPQHPREFQSRRLARNEGKELEL